MGKKMFYRTESFKKSKDKWYKKLGSDIEIEEESETIIRPQIIKTLKTQYDGGETYYQLCQAILREFRFKKDIHQIIFRLHSEGMSERTIQTWVKENTECSFSQKGINLLINRIKESYLTGRG